MAITEIEIFQQRSEEEITVLLHIPADEELEISEVVHISAKKAEEITEILYMQAEQGRGNIWDLTYVSQGGEGITEIQYIPSKEE